MQANVDILTLHSDSLDIFVRLSATTCCSRNLSGTGGGTHWAGTGRFSIHARKSNRVKSELFALQSDSTSLYNGMKKLRQAITSHFCDKYCKTP